MEKTIQNDLNTSDPIHGEVNCLEKGYGIQDKQVNYILNGASRLAIHQASLRKTT